jgi:transcription-repair coupling factor (superfamily II helicase)
MTVRLILASKESDTKLHFLNNKMDYNIKLKNLNESCVLTKIPGDAEAFIATEIAKNFPASDLLFIAQNDAEMELVAKQIRFFAPHLEILNFYAWDSLPYDRNSPKHLTLASRIKTLYRLATRKNNQQFFIITSVNSVLQKTITPLQIKNLGLHLETGSKISLNQISEFLTAKGYERQACANDAGEFAVRGGIIDIVMEQAADLIGYRVDFFGDEVESIKIFDPVTQITQEKVKTLELLPASEVIMTRQNIENFRHKYRQTFGAAINDQLYNAISEMRTYPGMEHWLPFFYEENLISLFDYIKNSQKEQLTAEQNIKQEARGKNHGKIIVFFSEKIFDIAAQRDLIVQEYYQARLKEQKIKDHVIYNPVAPDLLYLTTNFLKEKLEENIAICFNRFDLDQKNQRLMDLEIRAVPDFALAGRTNKKDPLQLMQEFIWQAFNKDAKINIAEPETELLARNFLSLLKAKKINIIIACLNKAFLERVCKILFDFGITVREVENFSATQNGWSPKVAICVLPLHFGFYTSNTIIIGEQALFGEKIIRKKTGKTSSQRLIEEGLSINCGELVVHRDHGIGKFDGIHTITTGSFEQEPQSLRLRDKQINRGVIKTDMIKIIYGGNDTLFVPVDDINLITRYGADNPLITLDRLGVAAWKNRKEKVKKRIKVAAEELLKIAAARHLKKAQVFVPEAHFYEEFKARFGFVETEDQAKAIEEIEQDLQKGSPMDRLICGDVGFGKTEVAMRAAAIIAGSQSDAQIAIITPTTLLARQHYKNFSKRFEDTKIKVAQLSRLISISKAKEVREEITCATVQIIIGTHALLHKNIKFKNLALVIIDEEQHFGVAQKERLKELRNEVHILTLSATPIPRTLQMSLTGVKDLSLIATPPLDRLAVRNFVMPYDSVIVCEAVMREYNRGGRIFFVVPRISDIEEMEPRLKILLPEIKITHAHGQMKPGQLDQIMNDFVDGKIDLLLSTTIIESGIDISEANTIIIYKAEMFGLAQLYQLRGRVGRGKVRAYSYFMLDNRKKIAAAAQKKLEVMQNLDSLGVGFTIASHDMDIRGSGNLLGGEQSGHIKETGVELYQQMLLETIEELKNKPDYSNSNHLKTAAMADNFDYNFDFSVQIKLGISLLIPENYISDLGLRMSFYKKIAALKSADDQDNLLNEMSDRFGKVPPEILNLMETARLKWACKKVGIEKLEVLGEGILISFKDNKFAAPQNLLQMVFASNNKIRIQAGQKVFFVCDVKSTALKISAANYVIHQLQQLVQNC